MESFPRGGRKPVIKRSSNKLFDESRSSKKRKRTKEKDNNVNVKDINSIATASRLSKATLHEGMTVLGRISQMYTKEYDLIVSIPGGFVGHVEVTNISKSYTNLLQNIIDTKAVRLNEFKPWQDLYNFGDYVVCYVKGKSEKKKWLYNLSMEPQLINQNIHNSYLVKNAKIVCTIKSIEDHGYVVDTGIANVRAFLATENVDKEKKYFPGNQLLCIIKEIETINNSSIIKLSAKKKKINNVSTHNIVSLDVLTPGTKLSLCVTKVLSNGLQVTFGKDNIGYINQVYLDNPLSMYAENMEVTGVLLYILPTVKLAYFSLLTDESEEENINRGKIIKAKVLYRVSDGIILKISKSGLRGFVSFPKSQVPFAKIPTVFKQGSTHKCRILAYNWMEHLYICTMEKELLKEEYFLISDLNYGNIVTVTIRDLYISGCILVQVGQISGLVPPIHVSDNDKSAINKLKIGDRIIARVLDFKSTSMNATFTLKQSLIKSELPVLHDIHDAQSGSKYHGTITKIDQNGLLVRFYGTLRGWVPRTALNSDTYNMNYSVGQTVTVCIESVEKDKRKIKLIIVNEKQNQQIVNFSIGEVIEGVVTESSIKGVHLTIQAKDNVATGFLPAGHMAPCIEIGKLLASRCTPGDRISVLVFATKPSLIFSYTLVTKERYRSFDSLKVGDCIPCTIRDRLQDGVRVILSIENYPKLGFVSYKNISNFELLDVNQILIVKITSINKRDKSLTLTMTLKDVWDSLLDNNAKMMAAVDILHLYLNKLSELVMQPFYKDKPISSVVLGQKVTGIVEKITSYGLVFELNNRLKGIVRNDHYSNEFKVGDKVFGTILWKNYVDEYVEVSLLPRIVNGISSKQETLPELPTEVVLRAEILLITKWLILVLIKRNGTGYLAALPVRRHVNDIAPDTTPYMLFAKIRVYVVLTRNESDIVPICMLKSAFETKIPKDSPATTKKELKTKKITEQQSVMLTNPPEQALKKEKKKYEAEIKKESRIKFIDESSELTNESSDESEKKEDEPIANDLQLHIQECGFSWDDDKINVAASPETSSDEEEEPEEEPKRKKKKLSAAERREQEREKERKIRQQEEALASNQAPNSTDQFDKLVLSSPDSSLVWSQYMVYHLQATEIEKARAVAKRAIKTINFREENERLNVWNAWLNLESRFGTPESLEDVFQKAVRTNDAFKIYTHMLIVHTDAGRKKELEKIIDTMIGKFKQDLQTWINCGAALLKIGLKEKSRHIMQRAMQSLPASQHVNLLARFANLENKLGDKERAQTLFEKILSSYPKRVDVWSCYIDCLIKSENIDKARKALEQACVQTLPVRKMKILFTKFKNFEEKYGTFESVARIVQMAADYVEKQCNKECKTYPKLKSILKN